MVTLVGQSILEGKHLCEGGVTPKDWMHRDDRAALPRHRLCARGLPARWRRRSPPAAWRDETYCDRAGGTDAALTAYHVDRSKQFVKERFGGALLVGAHVDPHILASYIEMTRFPAPDSESYRDTRGFGGLVRAADYIGQLGDPDYLRKGPALFYEFEEIGANAKYGYTRPGDLRKSFAGFYWNEVSPYIQDALRYLRQTQDGQEWIARLYALVFATEHQGVR